MADALVPETNAHMEKPYSSVVLLLKSLPFGYCLFVSKEMVGEDGVFPVFVLKLSHFTPIGSSFRC